MNKLIIAAALLLFSYEAFAQVPYFAGTVGDGKLYGYTSFKARPGINAQESYTCFQYGLGDHAAVGTDIYTGVGSAYWGFLFRYGLKISPWFGIGGQVTPSFDMNDSFNYSYTTGAVYMNGQLTSDGKLFWCSNTWLGLNRGSDNTYTNWEYLGYSFSLKNGRGITPMLGAIHSWKFDREVDIAAGLYYSIGSWNIYVWGNGFLHDHPRFVVGIDFAL